MPLRAAVDWLLDRNIQISGLSKLYREELGLMSGIDDSPA